MFLKREPFAAVPTTAVISLHCCLVRRYRSVRGEAEETMAARGGRGQAEDSKRRARGPTRGRQERERERKREG
jgi:hypothetical protein